MELRLDAAGQPLAIIDLGESSPNFFEEGDLGSTGGNLYIYLDGQEYGSLFFYRRDDGTMTVSLGAFDHEQQDWVERSELDRPVNSTAFVADRLPTEEG